MVEQLIKIFVVFFVVIEPISLVPLFGALTRGGGKKYRRVMAVKSVLLSAGIFLLFALSGELLLRTLGITIEAFRIAGGLLLFMIALDMVFARQSGLRSTTVKEQDEARYREDISVFPLAFPLMAGPGSLATLFLVMGDIGGDPTMFLGMLGVIGLILLITLGLLLLTTPIMRVLGETGANVISRLFGVILVALAVQYVVDGIQAIFM
ncbi:MAG: NAAT family transporter [Gammaproteobacteria bacterium]|nr:NAAT family transporter [Gammaproteobacteria bacterium]MCZ6827874.1 NAAT family transporter [Gammaproteobacteria bacterium]MCZ6912587.1 NAAT family transporter [Pseudomonadota bacterium]